MITSNIERLVEIAGPALSESTPRLSRECSALAGARAPELLKLYWTCNGFFAFESALHVLPLSDRQDELGLEQWNRPSLWRETYRGLADHALFFAEDAFGAQFCIASGAVYRFEPETGDRERVAGTLEDWARSVLAEPGPLTGWPIAHEWQKRHGALEPGKRLVPRVPFVLGGEFSVANLHALDAVRAMRFYGELAVQVHDAPDGTNIQLRVID